MLLRLTAIALLLGMLAGPGGTSPARGAELPDSARTDSGRWGAWGAMPAPSDSTVLRIESSPTPGWAPLVLVPYRLVSLPFSLLRLGLEGGIRTWGRHDLPSLLGPYPLPGHLMAELEAGGLGGLGMGVDVKDVAGGQALRLGLRAALGGSREARLGLRGGQGRARLVLSAGHARRAALAYYGLGPESSADDRSEHLQELNWGGLALELEPAAHLELELSATASGLAAYDREGPAFAEATAATGRSSGTAVGLRVVYDSTDQDGRPAHGGVVALKAARFFESDEGLADFTHYRASIERFVGLWNSDQTLALRAVTSWIEPEGDAPVAFTRLLAGENPDRQRGYPAGRWRDRGLALATAEYRWPVWAPSEAASLGLDALLFSDVGQVFGHLDALGDAIKTSWGGGLRLVGGGGDFSASLEIGHSDEGTRVALQFDQHFQHAKGGLFHGEEASVRH